MEACLDAIFSAFSQADRLAIGFVDVATVVIKITPDDGIVNYLDHCVQTQAHWPFTVVEDNFVGGRFCGHQTSLFQQIVGEGIAHPRGVTKVIGQRQLLETVEALVVDGRIFILKFIKVELERQLERLVVPGAAQGRIAFITHTDVGPCIAFKLNRCGHPHRILGGEVTTAKTRSTAAWSLAGWWESDASGDGCLCCGTHGA